MPEDYQDTAPPQTDPIERLYKTLSEKGYYTKSFDDFKKKYSTPQEIDKIYGVVSRDGLYTKSKDEFYGQYFTKPTQVKKKESSPSSLSSSGGLLPIGSGSAKDLLPEVSQNPTEVTGEIEPGVMTLGYKATDPTIRSGGEKEYSDEKMGVATKKLGKAALLGLSSVASGTLKSIGVAAKDIDLFGEYKNKTAEELGTYKAGKWIDDMVKDLVGELTPEEQGQFAVKLAQGVGQMGGFVVGGIGGKLLKLSPVLTTSALGAAVQGSSEYDNAIASGATPEQASKVFWINTAIGTTEALPIMGAFRKLDKYSGGLATGALARKLAATAGGRITNDVAQGFINESVQEATQGILTNITAKNTYDETRKIFDGVAEGAAIGGIIGSAMTGAISVIREKRMAGSLTPEEDAQLAKAEAFAQEKLDEATDPNKKEVTLSEKVTPKEEVGQFVQESAQVQQEKINVATQAQPELQKPEQKDDLQIASEAALKDINIPEVAKLFSENPEQGLKEAAEQLQASKGEAETARKFYGDTISDIALKRYPKESVIEEKLPEGEVEIDDDGRVVPFSKVGNTKIMFDRKNKKFTYETPTGRVSSPKQSKLAASKITPRYFRTWWKEMATDEQKEHIRATEGEVLDLLRKAQDYEYADDIETFLMRMIKDVKFHPSIMKDLTDVPKSKWTSEDVDNIRKGFNLDSFVKEYLGAGEDGLLAQEGFSGYDEQDIMNMIKEIIQKYPNGIRVKDITDRIKEDNPVYSLERLEEDFLELTGLDLNKSFEIYGEEKESLDKRQAEVQEPAQEAATEVSAEQPSTAQEVVGKPPTTEPPIEPPKPPEAAAAAGEEGVAGITHAANEVRRQERKLPEYQKNPTTEEALMAEAEQKLKDGYDVEDLFNRMEKGAMPTPVENFIRKIYIATLDAEIAKNPTDELLAKQKRFVELGDLANSKLGLNLWSLKGAGSPLNSISDFYVAKMQALGKDQLTEEQKEEVKKQYEDVKKTEDDAAEKISKLEEENAKLRAELEVKKAKASTKKQTKDFKKEREDLKKSIKDKWNKAGEDNMLTAVPIPYAKQLVAIAPDVAKLMRSYIEEGVTEFGEIMKRLHEDIREVEPRATEKDVADIISGQYDAPKETKGDLLAKLKTIKNRKSEEAVKIIAKIRSGDFAKPEKAVSWVDNKELKNKFPKEYNEALDAIKRKEDARHEFDIALIRDEMARRTVGQKLYAGLGKLAGTVKAITTGIDDSAVAIQTYVSLLRRPRTGARAVYEHFRQGISQKKFDRWLSALHSSPDFNDMREDGLDVTEPASLKEREKEEIFNNRFSGTVKIKGKEYKLIDAPLKPFERAFTTLGNVTRVTAYRNISRKYREEGYTREKDPELFKSLARRLNEQTGRGKVNEYVEQANKLVTLGIWSPKLMAAKFNQLGISDLASLFIPGTKGYYRSLHPKERTAAIRDIAQFAATVSALSYGLALAFGGDVDDDPLSSTFMDVKLPNGKSYNLTGGFSGYIRAIAQFMMGKKRKEGEEIKANRLETGSRFFRGKVPPLTGAVLNIASGRNFMGQPATPLGETINLAPISLRGIAQQIENDGTKSFLTQGVPTFFGFNVKNEKDYEPVLKPFTIYEQGRNATKSRVATEDEIKKVNENSQKIFQEDLKSAQKNKGWGYNQYNEMTIDDDEIVKKKPVDWNKLSDDQKKELESRLKASSKNKAKKLIKY